jgi:hypothetical protein
MIEKVTWLHELQGYMGITCRSYEAFPVLGK